MRGAVEQTVKHIDLATGQATAIKELIAKAKEEGGSQNAELLRTLSLADKHVDSLTRELLAAKAEAGTAQRALGVLEQQVNEQTKRANNVAAKYDALRPKHDALQTKHRRLKWIVSGALTALACALLWRFKGLLAIVPPPFNLVALVAAPGAIFGAVYGLVSLV